MSLIVSDAPEPIWVRPLLGPISEKVPTVVCNLLNAVDVVIGESLIDLCSQFKKIIETLFKRSFYFNTNVLTLRQFRRFQRFEDSIFIYGIHSLFHRVPYLPH